MDKKTKQNLKAKIIVATIIIILIGVLICLLNYEYISAKQKLNDINDITDVENDIYIPEGILRVTSSYEGDVQSYKVVLKSLQHTAEVVIPKYAVALRGKSDEDLKNYYDKNEKIVKIETGIEEVEDFVEFGKALNTLQGDTFTVKDYYVDITSVTEKFNRVEALMTFEYREGQSIDLKIVLERIIHKNVSPLKYLAPDTVVNK